MTAAWIFPVLGAQRLFELGLSRRNRKALEALGGTEVRPETFRAIVLLHAGFLASLAVESFPWRIPFDAATVVVLCALAALSAVRYWCMATLGVFWNVRIVVLPGHPPVRKGPYRFLRHPNYLVVALEFLLLPLLLRAPWTLFFFFPANLVVLRKRIGLENDALGRGAGPVRDEPRGRVSA